MPRRPSQSKTSSSPKRPRVYGNEARCRSALDRYIRSGGELLDQAVGVRVRLENEAASRREKVMAQFLAEPEWTDALRHWFGVTGRGMDKYLQGQMEEFLPIISAGLPPKDYKPRHWIGIENGEPWLRNALQELRELQASIGVSRGVASSSPAPARFEELLASGLIEERVVIDRAKEMRSPRTHR